MSMKTKDMLKDAAFQELTKHFQDYAAMRAAGSGLELHVLVLRKTQQPTIGVSAQNPAKSHKGLGRPWMMGFTLSEAELETHQIDAYFQEVLDQACDVLTLPDEQFYGECDKGLPSYSTWLKHRNN